MLTTREVIKTFYNALLQRFKKYRGNWEQNDPTADDYIKNRPFYTDETKKTVNVPKQKITISSESSGAKLVLPELIEFVVGQTYEVKWDDETYSCVAFDIDGIGAIGNQGVFDDGIDTGEPFIMMISKAHKMGIVYATTPKVIGTHTIEVTTTKVVTLDRKYLPDTIADKSEVETAKTAADDAWFTANNAQTTANNAINAATGSVKFTSSQNLTDAQKKQARTNIGAGTSSFSGRYDDLTNKPTAVQSDWEVNDNSDVAYIKNRTHYDYTAYSHITFLKRPTANSLINDIYYYGEVTGSSLGIEKGSIYKVSCNNGTSYISTCKKVPVKNQPLALTARVLGNAQLGVDAGYLDITNPNYPVTDVDTGEPWCFISYSHTAKNAIISTIPSFSIGSIYVQSDHELKQLDEKYIPSTIQRVGDDVIIPSSTSDSDKKFKITVDDSGKPTFTNSSDSADSYTPTDLPPVTASDSGKFLRVSSAGEWVAETIPNASGVSF